MLWAEDRVVDLAWVDDAHGRVLKKMQPIEKFGGESREEGVALINMGVDN